MDHASDASAGLRFAASRMGRGGAMKFAFVVPALSIMLAGCSGGGESPTPIPAPSVSATAAATLAPEPTPPATPTPGAPKHIVLDTSPKPQPPEVTRTMGAPPSSAYPAWDGKSTVIYDTKTGSTRDLGPGTQPASFSPDGTKAAWA